jgi:hypothetical protein
MCAGVLQVKDALGLGRDPDDASWLTIQTLNRDTQKMELKGEVLLTIEVSYICLCACLPWLGADSPRACFGLCNVAPHICGGSCVFLRARAWWSTGRDSCVWADMVGAPWRRASAARAHLSFPRPSPPHVPTVHAESMC